MPTITDIASTNGDFDVLVAALGFLDGEFPGLDLIPTLSAPETDVTVFAPTDAAFGQLAADLGFTGDTADEGAVAGFLTTHLPAETLRDVVLYHVSPGGQTLAELNTEGTIDTLLGETITSIGTRLADNEPDLIDPTIVLEDVVASNGIIQAIDRVLLPIDLPGNTINSIAAVASGNPDFSVLVAALGFLDATFDSLDLVATLSDANTDVTVFAPTNAAFGQLAVDLGFTGDPADATAVTDFLVTNVPAETLRDVVLYHVSPGAQTLAEIQAAGTVDTLLGATITSDGPTLVDNEPDLIDPSVILEDVPADNGIIQAIDRVLLPVDLPGNDVPTITGLVASSGPGFDDNAGDFDILLAAVTTAGLADVLDDPNADFTVFAPTDGAFVSLAANLGFSGSDEGEAWDYLVEALTLLGGGNPIPLLTTVLTYHVAPESLQASQVLASSEITTLAGTVGVDGTTLVDNDPDLPDPTLIATDIQTANGVVHGIDNVLIPADLLASNGSNDVDFIIASDRFNIIATFGDNDFVDGNGNTDLIFVGSGDDTVLGGTGSDFIRLARGDDSADGESGRDFIWGGRGNDDIKGGAGLDFLNGGSGDDTLTGGEGLDFLRGGNGIDTFVFVEGADYDVVRDFREGDLIDVSDFGFTSFSEIEDNIFTFNGHTHIGFGTGDRLVLFGTNQNEIGAEDFIFQGDTIA